MNYELIIIFISLMIYLFKLKLLGNLEQLLSKEFQF